MNRLTEAIKRNDPADEEARADDEVRRDLEQQAIYRAYHQNKQQIPGRRERPS